MPIIGVIASGISGNLYSSSFDSIATATVSSPTGTVTFSGIPQTYTHLQLRMVSRDTGSDVNGSPIYMYFNSDTSSSNYADHTIYGDGSAVTVVGYQNFGGYILLNRFTNPSYNASIFGALVVDILDYRNTNKNKTVRSFGGYDVNGSGGRSYLTSGLWVNTSAITSLTLNYNNAALATNSTYALYGIKVA